MTDICGGLEEGELSEGASTSRVNDSFGNSLVVEAVNLISG